MALERLTQITEVGIQSGITLRNVNVEGAYVSGVITATSLNITSGGANFTGVVTATSFVGNITGNINSTGISTFFGGLLVGTGASVSSPASNILTLGTNSVERVRITSSGVVGVNTTAVDAQLEVHSATSKINAATIKTSTGASGYVGLAFMAGQTTAGREKAAIYFQETNGGAHYTGDIVFALNSTSGSAVQVSTSDERLRITSSGNLGIGTNNPVNRFHATQYSANTDVATFQIGSASAYTGFVNCRVGTTGSGTFIGGLYTPDGSLQGLQGTNGLIFSTSGSNIERARIDSTGNLGIGTTNPGAKLHVSGTGRFSESLYANPLTLSSSLSWINSAYGAISNSTVLSLNNLLIGQNIRGYISSIDGGTTDNSFRNIVTYGAGSMGHAGTEYCFGGTTKFYNGTAASTANTVFTPTLSMQIDGSGRVTTPYQVAFHVPKTVGDTLTTTAAKLSFSSATYDVGNNYSDANDRFTAPVAGKYFFYTSINVLNSGNATLIYIRKNGSTYGQIFYAATNYPRMDFNPVGIIDLAASDYVEIYGSISSGTVSVDNAGYFGGYLLG